MDGNSQCGNYTASLFFGARVFFRDVNWTGLYELHALVYGAGFLRCPLILPRHCIKKHTEGDAGSYPSRDISTSARFERLCPAILGSAGIRQKTRVQQSPTNGQSSQENSFKEEL